MIQTITHYRYGHRQAIGFEPPVSVSEAQYLIGETPARYPVPAKTVEVEYNPKPWGKGIAIWVGLGQPHYDVHVYLPKIGKFL